MATLIGENLESLITVLDDDVTRLIVSRESPTQVPDSYIREGASGQYTKLTNNKDYTPEFTSAIRRKIPVTRVDGTKFLVDLTLPADYKPGTRLPAMFWFYPREYTDQYEYDRSRRTTNKNRFPATNPRSMDFLVTQGYAVVEPDAPILGPNGRMIHDMYLYQVKGPKESTKPWDYYKQLAVLPAAGHEPSGLGVRRSRRPPSPSSITHTDPSVHWTMSRSRLGKT